MMKRGISIALAVSMWGGLPSAGRAAGSSSDEWKQAAPAPSVDNFDAAQKHVKQGRYREAEAALQKAAAEDPRNPDVLNLLAYSQRKQGRLEDAFANYDKALRFRPRFPEAREYLGEAHIQAALREIETLKSYGAEGNEALEELMEAFRSAAAKLK